jgi:hypothetical protein
MRMTLHGHGIETNVTNVFMRKWAQLGSCAFARTHAVADMASAISNLSKQALLMMCWRQQSRWQWKGLEAVFMSLVTQDPGLDHLPLI